MGLKGIEWNILEEECKESFNCMCRGKKELAERLADLVYRCGYDKDRLRIYRTGSWYNIMYE